MNILQGMRAGTGRRGVGESGPRDYKTSKYKKSVMKIEETRGWGSSAGADRSGKERTTCNRHLVLTLQILEFEFSFFNLYSFRCISSDRIAMSEKQRV